MLRLFKLLIPRLELFISIYELLQDAISKIICAGFTDAKMENLLFIKEINEIGFCAHLFILIGYIYP